MDKVIQFRGVTESSEEDGASVYQIYVEQALLGFLYLDKCSYTVAWNGVVDFHQVGEQAFDFAALQAKPEKWSWLRRRPTPKAFVSFILVGEDPKLVEFDLEDPTQHEEYDRTLDQADIISFARFDFETHVSHAPLNFTFTAENPVSTDYQDSELAIQLPRPLPLSEESFKWIIDRHVLSKSLSGNVDVATSAAELSHLVGASTPFAHVKQVST